MRRPTRRWALVISMAAAAWGCGGGGGSGEPPFDVSPVAVGDTSSALDPSWRRGPFMEVFVRAYQDSDGDGEGDLRGLVSRLDYLQALGVRGLWLMPITRSQDHEHGYMVTDHRQVEADYGSLEDLDALVAAAHARGIGVVLDHVINHSGSRHPGFLASASPYSPWRAWWVWSVDHPTGWQTWTGADPWHPAPAVGSGWYYGPFGAALPDFNWKNPEVEAYHEDTLRFWLNRGVDGLRIDAAHLLVENGPQAYSDQPETRAALGRVRRVVDEYRNRFMVCEAPGYLEYAAAAVCGGAFAFDTGPDPGGGGSQRMVLAARGDADATAIVARAPFQEPIGRASKLLANHDLFAGRRLADQLGGDTPAYRLAAATLLLMPGTPFLYYGEEIGMAGVPLPQADPYTDDRQRGVMSWTGDTANAGFSARSRLDGPRAATDPAYKYLVPAPNVATANVEAEAADPGSLLRHYQALIALRNGHRALSAGGYALLAQQGASFVFTRRHSEEDVVVAMNYQASPVEAGWFCGLDVYASYEPLFDYGTTASTLVTDSDGCIGSLSLPGQSVQVLRHARASDPFRDRVALFVRGDFDGWGAPLSALLAYLGDDTYAVTLHLPAGDQLFKIADADWSPLTNLGALFGRTVVPGEPVPLEQTQWHGGGVGDDLRLSVAAEGDYRFVLDASDVLAPVLTVSPVAAQPPAAR